MRTSRGIVLSVLLATLLTPGCRELEQAAAPPPPAAPDTAGENARPGTPDWTLHRKGGRHEIEGYADRVSVLPGQSFRLFVSTTTPGFTAEAFRVGWYGGARARKVWESPRQPGLRQEAPATDLRTRTVTAPWKPSLTVTTTHWPEGVYLLRLTADGGAQRYVPLTLRSASTKGRLVILNATTTWQAYNLWGGRNLYKGPGGHADPRLLDRARDLNV